MSEVPQVTMEQLLQVIQTLQDEVAELKATIAAQNTAPVPASPTPATPSPAKATKTKSATPKGLKAATLTIADIPKTAAELASMNRYDLFACAEYLEIPNHHLGVHGVTRSDLEKSVLAALVKKGIATAPAPAPASAPKGGEVEV